MNILSNKNLNVLNKKLKVIHSLELSNFSKKKNYIQKIINFINSINFEIFK